MVWVGTLVISEPTTNLRHSTVSCAVALVFPISFKTRRILTQAIYALKETALLPDVTSFYQSHYFFVSIYLPRYNHIIFKVSGISPLELPVTTPWIN